MEKEKIQEGEIISEEEINADDEKNPKEIAVIRPDREHRQVSVSPAQMQAQAKRDTELRKIVTDYIKQNLVEGQDYGRIEVKGVMSKPTLFKPGSEKFFSLFKLRPVFRKDTETLEMLGNEPGIIAYICDLVDSRGNIIGEGRGAAKVDVKESRDFDINKQVKLAEKRAQMDAILRTGGLSDFFTQDIEDMPTEKKSRPMTARVPAKKTYSSYARNSGTSRPATAPQKEYLLKLLEDVGDDIGKDELSSLTASEASKKINKLLKNKREGGFR